MAASFAGICCVTTVAKGYAEEDGSHEPPAANTSLPRAHLHQVVRRRIGVGRTRIWLRRQN